jgi:hypothetical protein
MRTILLLIAVNFAGLPQASAAAIEGEYEGGFHGNLNVTPTAQANRFNIWLGVGAGSCGGDILVKNRVGRLVDSRIRFSHRMNSRPCETTIEFRDQGAFVSDTCISAESEAQSTCAMMGEYTRIRR